MIGLLVTAGLVVTTGQAQPDRRTLVTNLKELRPKVNRVRARKCLPARTIHHPARALSTRKVVFALRFWRGRLVRARAHDSRCEVIPAWPWIALASCESGRTWNYNGSSGFDGGFQFLPSTWTAAKGAVPRAQPYAYAYQAPAYVQYLVARSWLARTSWLQWPVCSQVIGAR